MSRKHGDVLLGHLCCVSPPGVARPCRLLCEGRREQPCALRPGPGHGAVASFWGGWKSQQGRQNINFLVVLRWARREAFGAP